MDTLSPGTSIGDKYIITELLGVGGMGHVYHARHKQVTEFEVAIKVLDPAFAATVESRDRFRNEVLAGYRAHHPNVVQMYEYFDLGTVQAFAMEYVNAGTIQDAMEEGPLPFDLTVSLVKQIALGLSALHRAGTYHRDLKPANVLLTEAGLVKLTDFGVARVRGTARFEDGGLLAGTPKYVPPEYVETGESDHRGDIYALGVIAYEMLSGRSPFRSDTSTSLLKERLEVRGNDLAQLRSDVPAEMRGLVERCMSVSVIQRYPHATDVVDAARALQRQYGLGEAEGCDDPTPNTRLMWSNFVSECREAQEAQLEELRREEIPL